MNLSRKLASSLFVAFFATIVACSSGDEHNHPAPDPQSDVETIVPASDATKNDLGVVEWRVTPGKVDHSFVVAGLDSAGETHAEVAMQIEARGQNAGVFTYDIKGPEAFTLRFQFEGETQTNNADEMAKAPRARAVFERMSADLGNVGATTTPTAALTTQSHVPATGSSGSSGGDLVRRGQRLNGEPTCLLDRSGNGCRGQLVQAVAGIVGTGICVLTAPATLGLQMAGCVAAGVATAGTIYAMTEAGCEQRPCSQRAK